MTAQTIKHGAPEAMQPEPADTTAPYIAAQVAECAALGLAINTRIAMAIAAQYQAPYGAGEDFAAFASTGTITTDFADVITDQCADIALHPETYSFGAADDSDDAHAQACQAAQSELRALLDYVHSSTVTPWSVGRNTAGYLPESAPYVTLEYADAVQAYRTELEQAPDAIYGDMYECTCDDNELCAYHLEEAAIAAHLSDDAPSVVSGRVFGREATLSYAVTEDQTLNTVYWLEQCEPMSYRAFLDDRNNDY
ncbi:MAG TPA: hypothetical protein VE326_11100 [Candidatus Binatia bacterium]|nr:hypothetical protein [Candidatus Binatia bacterium]